MKSRLRVVGIGAAVAALVLATSALIVFGRGTFAVKTMAARARPATGAGPDAGGTTSRKVRAMIPAPRIRPTVPIFTSIPMACSVLPAATIRRLVPIPRPTVDKMGGEAASTCEFYTSSGDRFRAVQIDVRAFMPLDQHDEAMRMTIRSFDAQWRRVQQEKTPQTSSLRRFSGLGDDAFQRYWIDTAIKVAVGEATVRYRNVVLTVQYTDEARSPRGRAGSERHCLAEAAAAAREGLTSFK